MLCGSSAPIILRSRFGHVRFRDLTRQMVLAFYREMADKYSSITSRERIQDMALVEDYAREQGWMKTEPIRDALKKLYGVSPKIRTFTADGGIPAAHRRPPAGRP